MADLTPTEQANAYIKERMFFVPRMFQVLTGAGVTEPPKLFADYYASVWGDGNLPRKIKELMFVAIGISWRSPRCLVHVIPAIEAGATDGEILETCAVGFNAAGFVPGGPGIPYAFEYALKVLEIASKYRKGEPWEYMQPAEFRT